MKKPVETRGSGDYAKVLAGVTDLLDAARRASARVVNSLMTATYWEIGRRIVEHEQAGQKRAGYGEEVVRNLSADLTRRFGRGHFHLNATADLPLIKRCARELVFAGL